VRIRALALATAAVLAAASGGWADEQRDRQPFADDPRARGTVAVPPGRASVDALLRRVAEKSGMELVAERPLRHSAVAVAVREAPADRILAALAVAVNARWYAVDGAYVLATDARLARLAPLSFHEWAGALSGSFDRLVDGLSPADWDRLWSGGEITFDPERAAPRTRRLLSEIGAAAYLNETIPLPRAVIGGQGISLSMRNSACGVELGLCFRTHLGPSGPIMSRPISVPRK
jgi:hypothetical protein